MHREKDIDPDGRFPIVDPLTGSIDADALSVFTKRVRRLPTAITKLVGASMTAAVISIICVNASVAS